MRVLIWLGTFILFIIAIVGLLISGKFVNSIKDAYKTAKNLQIGKGVTNK